MRRWNRWLGPLLVVLPLAAAANMGGSSGDGNALAEVRERIESGEYGAAIERLETLAGDNPDSADVYNLLGYSHRRLGQYQRAERYYRQALAIEPEHRDANEYLGELYLQTDRPDLARERLQVLDDACFFGCEAYDELKAAIDAYEGRTD